MQSQVITIPSRGRSDIIKQRTLKLIDGTENIYVVVEPQDYEIYEHTLEDYDINLLKLPSNGRGLTYARFFIQDYFKDKIRYVWQLDDNLDQLLIRNGPTDGGNPHLDKIEWLDIPAQQVFDETLAIMKEKG
ncbi:MAG: hypothetical protein ACFFCV_05625 [Promethearchaeota archaeon]